MEKLCNKTALNCILVTLSVRKSWFRRSPLSELLENDAIREALSADTNPLQDSITSQLVQNQVGLQFASLKDGENNKRTNKKVIVVKLFILMFYSF